MNTRIDIEEIKTLLKHRYPFLLVDKVLGLVKEKSIKAVKNVTYNEPYFGGHFPQMAIMPGVLILESMAQVSGILAVKSFSNLGENAFLTSIDNAKFRDKVVPGDVLSIFAQIIRNNSMITKFIVEAKVSDKLVAEATLCLYWSQKNNNEDKAN